MQDHVHCARKRCRVALLKFADTGLNPMKHIFFSALFLFNTAVAPVFAQASSNVTAAATTPARLPISTPVLSPEIGSDRMVTFRLRAANAQGVMVDGQWPNGRAAMSKDSNGVWSVTVGPVGPGVWEYSFQVGGLTMIDPAIL